MSSVVYFDQRTHACACVCMVENDQNHCKMSEKVLFSSCVREAYERLTIIIVGALKREAFISELDS